MCLRFLSTVCFQMSPQMANSRGCIVTLVAFLCLSPLCGLYVSAYWMFPGMHSHIGCICLVFSTVGFQMYPQSACIKGCIVTLAAFFALFSTVCSQMFPQNVCQRGCVVSLVAYVRLFSTLYYQMSSQPTCLRRWNVTLISHLFAFSPMFIFKEAPRVAFTHFLS